MIIYNVTTKMDDSIAAEWLQWLKGNHIAEMIATGCFTHATILQLVETDETDGPTYAVQYHSASRDLYHQYIQLYADAMRKKVAEKWGNKIVSFRSVLEVVN